MKGPWTAKFRFEVGGTVMVDVGKGSLVLGVVTKRRTSSFGKKYTIILNGSSKEKEFPERRVSTHPLVI